MEKTIKELAEMNRDQLYEEAVVMHGTIRLLRFQLSCTEGRLEQAERPADTVAH